MIITGRRRLHSFTSLLIWSLYSASLIIVIDPSDCLFSWNTLNFFSDRGRGRDILHPWFPSVYQHHRPRHDLLSHQVDLEILIVCSKTFLFLPSPTFSGNLLFIGIDNLIVIGSIMIPHHLKIDFWKLCEFLFNPIEPQYILNHINRTYDYLNCYQNLIDMLLLVNLTSGFSSSGSSSTVTLTRFSPRRPSIDYNDNQSHDSVSLKVSLSFFVISSSVSSFRHSLTSFIVVWIRWLLSILISWRITPLSFSLLPTLFWVKWSSCNEFNNLLNQMSRPFMQTKEPDFQI